MNRTENRKYIQSVERAMNILNLIGENGELKLNEISEMTGLKSTTALGLIQTLEHTGYLTRSNKASYALGLNSFKLGISYNRNNQMAANIHKILEKIVDEIQETAYFEIKVGSRYYYYDVMTSKQPLRVCPDDDLFITLPDNSAVSKIYDGWERGMRYATDLEGITPGLNCFAVPFIVHGTILGAIAITGPASRFKAEEMEATYIKYCSILDELGFRNYLPASGEHTE